MDQLPGAIKPIHAPEPVAEVMPVSLGKIFELVRVGIQAPGSHFVKKGFPDMGTGTVDQGDFGPATPTQAIAQACGQLESPRTAAYHNDAVGPLRVKQMLLL